MHSDRGMIVGICLGKGCGCKGPEVRAVFADLLDEDEVGENQEEEEALVEEEEEEEVPQVEVASYVAWNEEEVFLVLHNQILYQKMEGKHFKEGKDRECKY